MRKTLIVTVGASAAENKELAGVWPKLKTVFGDEEDAKTVLERWEESPDELEIAESMLLEAHREFWNKNENYWDNRSKSRQTSAEAISTYMAIRSGVLSLLQPGHDRIVLLASDTEVGKACGRINERLLRSAVFWRGGAAESDVVLKVLEGLNPKPKDENAPLPEISSQIRRIVEEHADSPDRELYVNITGGYKGTVPPLTHVCWSEKYRNRAKLLYMHETMRATVVLSPGQEGREMRETIRHRMYVRS
jgi:hypothetical protein